jgi:hypothetical protein
MQKRLESWNADFSSDWRVVEQFRYLVFLDEFREVVSKRDWRWCGGTLLHYAIRKRDPRLTLLLIEHLSMFEWRVEDWSGRLPLDFLSAPFLLELERVDHDSLDRLFRLNGEKACSRLVAAFIAANDADLLLLLLEHSSLFQF